MQYQLAAGVTLHVLPTKQFKLNYVMVNFAEPQTKVNPTARNLLANVLETSTHRFPTQTALSRQLAKMYGTTVDMSVGRIGLDHCLRLTMSFVNDHFTATPITEDAFKILGELLFDPLVDDGEFDGPTFRVQLMNLRSTLAAMRDDKQLYAQAQLDRLYYDPLSPLSTPSYGTEEVLETMTAQKLVATYRDMIDHDRVDIYVIGDVDSDRIADRLRKLPFKDRQTGPTKLFYEQPLREHIARQTEVQPVVQAKLNLAYQLPVYYRQKGHFAAMVMNGMLGGTPYSKLFINVREKESLAYYATSRHRMFSGFLTVATGINAENAKRVENLINQQIQDLAAGKFSDDMFNRVKESMINQLRAARDSAPYVLSQSLLEDIAAVDPVDIYQRLAAVGRGDVQRMASKLKLQAVYLLRGEN